MIDSTQEYLDVLKQVDPELYLVRTSLIDSGISPLVIPKIVRPLGRLASGSGYGKVEILVRKGAVEQINLTETHALKSLALWQTTQI